MSEMLIQAHLGAIQIPNGIQGQVGGYRPFNSNKNILIAKLAVQVQDNTIPLRLLNYCNKPRTINPKERLATFTPWTANIANIARPYIDQPNNANTSHQPLSPSPNMTMPPSNHNGNTTEESINKQSITPLPPGVDISTSVLDPNQKAGLLSLLNEFSDVFANPQTSELGHCKVVTHRIDIKPDSRPIQKLPYITSPMKRQEMDRQVQKMLEQGIIKPADGGQWASPALLVPK